MIFLFTHTLTSPTGEQHAVRLALTAQEAQQLKAAGLTAPDFRLVEQLLDGYGDPARDPSFLGILAPVLDQTYLH